MRNRPREFDWQFEARCKGLASEVFYPPDNERGERRRRREERAKGICRTCPVLRRCLEYALTFREPFGIWAATTPLERSQILESMPQRVANPSVRLAMGRGAITQVAKLGARPPGFRSEG